MLQVYLETVSRDDVFFTDHLHSSMFTTLVAIEGMVQVSSTDTQTSRFPRSDVSVLESVYGCANS